MKEIDIIIPSHRPDFVKAVRYAMLPHMARHWNGDGCPSFSKLINDCIVDCKTEIVVIVADKCYPRAHQIDKMVNLLDEGFCLVGLYRFGCFAFHKELIRRIGFFDERFARGGYEDTDFVVRMREANFATYLTTEVRSMVLETTWDHRISYYYFEKKWNIYPAANWMVNSVRTIPEEQYDYDLGPPRPDIVYKPWSESQGFDITRKF